MGFYVIIICVSVIALVWTGVGIYISINNSTGEYYDSFGLIAFSLCATLAILFIGMIVWSEHNKAIADISIDDYMRVNEWSEHNEFLRNKMKGYLEDGKITKTEFVEIKESIESVEKERLRKQMEY